jgi:2-polyprenyl-6-methoxyphenol hydroxylase-like FAD-dependent oxidoreductase
MRMLPCSDFCQQCCALWRRHESHAYGIPGKVQQTIGGKTQGVRNRLVVGADGRNSLVRTSAGFPIHHDPARRLFAGVLLENTPLAPNAWHEVLDPDRGEVVF